LTTAGTLLALVFAVAADSGAADKLVQLQAPIRISLEETFVAGAAKVRLTLTASQSAPCGRLITSVDRRGTEIWVMVDGIRPPSGGRCELMNPPPPSATIELTADTGRRRLILRYGPRSETFALEITDKQIAIDPVGPQSLSELESRGTLLRAPPQAVWVAIAYPSEAARKRYRRQAADLVAALEAAGARRFTPASGKYAARFNAWRALDPKAGPGTSEPPPPVDYHYFTYSGRFETLEAIGGRFKKYDRPHDRSGPFMSVHISGWHGRAFNTR
jgi:hypothetical protein